VTEATGERNNSAADESETQSEVKFFSSSSCIKYQQLRKIEVEQARITSNVGIRGLPILQLRNNGELQDPTSLTTEESPNAETSCGEAEDAS
jgi:hypothetical protein